MSVQKLSKAFFLNQNVVEVAKALLGKHLCTNIEGKFTKGIITEVEAYAGVNDKACHANNGKRTARTEIMYAEGGKSYVYLCYGVHHLFNVVTNVQDQADAVLIRAIEPIEGKDVMLERRGKTKLDKSLSSGPGVLTKALGIDFKQHNGIDLRGETVWIEDSSPIDENAIVSTTRIGVDYAEEDALKPWRFYIKGNKWVSKK